MDTIRMTERGNRVLTAKITSMRTEVERVVPNTLVRSGFAATRWGQRVPPFGGEAGVFIRYLSVLPVVKNSGGLGSL